MTVMEAGYLEIEVALDQELEPSAKNVIYTILEEMGISQIIINNVYCVWSLILSSLSNYYLLFYGNGWLY